MKFWIVVLIALLSTANLAIGVSIAPEIVKQLKDSGKLQDIVVSDRNARARGVWQPNSTPYRFGATADVETLHCLIILVDFSDMTHESGFHSESTNFDTLLFSRGVRHPGSMADYYKETSYNQAYLTGQVTAWLRMPQPYAYYVDGQRGFGNYPNNAQRLTEDAVAAADPYVDFSLYDNNGDQMVDALFVVHAGPGYEDTGNANYIHSHAWSTHTQMDVDGVHVRGYSMEPEETGSGGLINIGVFCHEFGHVLGLPDLYDYDYDSDGVGWWSLMAGGSWGGGGAIPVHFDGWSRYRLGWVNPTVITDNLVQEQIDAVEYSPDVYQLFPFGSASPQYFLVENRRQKLFDVSIPGSGLLIYHVDENAPNNDDQTHYKVAVEQADGLFDLEHNRAANAGDPWPGATNHRCFDDFSLPDAHLYNGSASEIAVANISDSDSIMYADLGVVYIDPLYELAYIFFNDSTGNGNGRPEPGETCQLIFSAQNIRAGVDDLVVTASCSDSQVLFADSVSDLGTMPLNEFFDNRSDLITFTIPMDYESKFADFTLTFTARDGLYHEQFVTSRMLGIPNLILVDDDAGLGLETYYENALQNAGKSYERWDVSTQGSPVAALVNYDYAIWFTGDTRETSMSESDVAGLIGFLNGGGRLLVTSQDFVQRLSERGSVNDTILLHQYLKVGYDTLANDHREYGQSGTVFDGMGFLSTGMDGSYNQYSQDALIAYTGGQVLMTYRTGETACVGIVSNYTAITVGFGIEALTDRYPDLYNNLSDFMGAAFEFLRQPVSVDEEPSSLPENLSLAQNYPNPFNPTTQIAFELPESGPITLEIYDILGRLIDKPIDGTLSAGSHSITWDGSRVSSGIYFYRLSTGDSFQIKRMTLMK